MSATLFTRFPEAIVVASGMGAGTAVICAIAAGVALSVRDWRAGSVLVATCAFGTLASLLAGAQEIWWPLWVAGAGVILGSLLALRTRAHRRDVQRPRYRRGRDPRTADAIPDEDPAPPRLR